MRKDPLSRRSISEALAVTCGAFPISCQTGTEIKPEPPVTPIGMGKSTRGVELASVDELDERQAASWMKQAAAMPVFGGKKR